VIVILAAASDWVDGRLARANQQVTRAGEVLDPIADKAFMLAALLTLGIEGWIPLWSLPLLLSRDLGVILGAAIAAARGFRGRMPARRAGKVVTWLQFGAIAAILVWPDLARWLAPAVAVAGLIALRDYARWFGRAGAAEHASRTRE
jgi:CDP-diacylglycerol--glycerol-3-phosphate 3-phosphatidyltransferase